MKNISHRRQAERLLSDASFTDNRRKPLRRNGGDIDPQEHAALIARAQVHATLARNEEEDASRADMRDANTLLRRQLSDTKRLLAEHIAEGLTRNNPSSWLLVRELAQHLDEANLNIDDAIDELITERGVDVKWAWKRPSSRLCEDGRSWVDLGGQRHDLTKAYIDRDGQRWTWTGKVDDHDGYPLFASEKGGSEHALDTLTVFGAKPEDGDR